MNDDDNLIAARLMSIEDAVASVEWPTHDYVVSYDSWHETNEIISESNNNFVNKTTNEMKSTFATSESFTSRRTREKVCDRIAVVKWNETKSEKMWFMVKVNETEIMNRTKEKTEVHSGFNGSI